MKKHESAWGFMQQFQGQSKERREVLTTTFAGLPMFDATTETAIVVVDEDILGARPGDPQNCLFALACKRALRSQQVVFLRTRAYIDVPVSPSEAARIGSERKILRYQIPPAARRQIENLDSGGSVEMGLFILKPPSKGERLGVQRRPSKGPGGHRKPNGRNVDSLTLTGVRNGSGRYQIFARSV
jgi:hypothetical protein